MQVLGKEEKREKEWADFSRNKIPRRNWKTGFQKVTLQIHSAFAFRVILMQHPRVTFQAKATLSPFPFICREGLVQRLENLGSLEGADVLGLRFWLRREGRRTWATSPSKGSKKEELCRGRTSNFRTVTTQGYFKTFSNSEYFLETWKYFQVLRKLTECFKCLELFQGQEFQMFVRKPLHISV